MKEEAWARLDAGQQREVNAARRAAAQRLVPKANGKQRSTYDPTGGYPEDAEEQMSAWSAARGKSLAE